jgi:hypothetical protein
VLNSINTNLKNDSRVRSRFISTINKEREKAKPVVRQGRKAVDPNESEDSRVASEKMRYML